MIDEKKLIEDLEYFISHTTEEMPEHYAYMRIKWLIEKQPKISLENKTSDKWIPVEEALPETNENKKYLVCGKNGGLYIAEFVCRNIRGELIRPWWSAHGRYCPNPIAWQPLPKYEG